MHIFRFFKARVKIHQTMSYFKQKASSYSKFGSIFSGREVTLLQFLAEILYAINKSSTLKRKFSDLPLLILKFTKFLMSFLEPKASFSSNFLLISVMRANSSVLFHLKLYMLSTKGINQNANYQTFN